jgi:hypothetical protein
MKTIARSRRSRGGAAAAVCLIMLAIVSCAGGANASPTLRLGIDSRYVEATFKVYQYDIDHREIVNAEWADLLGVHGEICMRWSLGEASTVGFAPGLSFFLLGDWETYGGVGGTLTSGTNLGAEIALPVEFAFQVSERFELGSVVGVAFSYIGFSEPEGIRWGSEQDCYEGGVGWALLDIVLGVQAGYRFNDRMGMILRYRFSGGELGGYADYMDEPPPQYLNNGGLQLMLDYRLGE